MNDKQFSIVWAAALEESSRAAFVSDWALSSIFADPDEPVQDVPAELVEQLEGIWDVAHMSVKDLRSVTGLSRTVFAERFCIPLRTVEDWEAARRNPPDYVRLMMAQLVGVLTR